MKNAVRLIECSLPLFVAYVYAESGWPEVDTSTAALEAQWFTFGQGARGV